MSGIWSWWTIGIVCSFLANQGILLKLGKGIVHVQLTLKFTWCDDHLSMQWSSPLEVSLSFTICLLACIIIIIRTSHSQPKGLCSLIISQQNQLVLMELAINLYKHILFLSPSYKPLDQALSHFYCQWRAIFTHQKWLLQLRDDVKWVKSNLIRKTGLSDIQFYILHVNYWG